MWTAGGRAGRVGGAPVPVCRWLASGDAESGFPRDQVGVRGRRGCAEGARGQLRAGVRAVGGGREGSRGAKVGRCVWAAACVWLAQLEAFGDVLQERRLPGVWGSVRLVVGARSPKGGRL